MILQTEIVGCSWLLVVVVPVAVEVVEKVLNQQNSMSDGMVHVRLADRKALGINAGFDNRSRYNLHLSQSCSRYASKG